MGRLIPSPLLSIIILSGIVIGLNIDTTTVGDLASVSGGLPSFLIPNVPLNMETLFVILPFSLTLAGIGLIGSLLTLTLIDEMTGTEGNANAQAATQAYGADPLGQMNEIMNEPGTIGYQGGWFSTVMPDIVSRYEHSAALQRQNQPIVDIQQ